MIGLWVGLTVKWTDRLNGGFFLLSVFVSLCLSCWCILCLLATSATLDGANSTDA